MCQKTQEQGWLKVLEVEEQVKVESVYTILKEEVKDQNESVYELGVGSKTALRD